MIVGEKIKKIRNLMTKKDLELILLSKNSNIAWLSAGFNNRIVDFANTGAIKIAVFKNKVEIITDNIEEKRIINEGNFSDDNLIVIPWYEDDDYLKNIINKYKSASDIYQKEAQFIGDDFKRLRYVLNNDEINKYKKLAKKTAQIIREIILSVKRGQTEQEIKADLTAELLKNNIHPHLTIVAADQRIFDYRHPISTNKKVDKYLMIVVCAERDGLIVNMTRLLHFGKLPHSLKKKAEAVKKIDAAFINNTRPQKTAGEVFRKSIKAYDKYAYPDEWKNHHQGGATGYETRDYIANRHTTEVVHKDQAFAWNPSLKGVKSEDTILVKEEENEILSYDPKWPGEEIECCGRKIYRPNIMIR